MPDTAPAMRFTAQAQWNRRAPYPGRGQNRRQGRRCPRRLQAEEARAAPSNSRVRSGSHAWEWRRGQWATAIHRKPFSSSAVEKAATKPSARSCPSVMRGLSPTRSASNGYARRFSPSAPKDLKAKKGF